MSGTRGKTSIVRTLASVLRAEGMTVLAKTTGSEARYILPDGEEEDVIRRGITSVLEQKKLIRKAAKLNVDCIITEIMSIQPENHIIETHKLIKPGITVFSNFRPDHTDVAGNTIESVSGLFLNDIYPGSKVFIHKNDANSLLTCHINKNKCVLNKAQNKKSNGLVSDNRALINHFSDNLDLVFEISENLGIDRITINKGIKNVSMDIGKFEIFRFISEKKEIFFINSFAANDPESTLQIINKTRNILNLTEGKILGLMSLRSDRGDRSKQWLEYLVGNQDIFSLLYFTGIHSGIFKRKIPASVMLKNKDPEFITNYIINSSEDKSIIFGLANIKGIGTKLLNYWKNNGGLIENGKLKMENCLPAEVQGTKEGKWKIENEK